jgi:hypothetical protein
MIYNKKLIQYEKTENFIKVKYNNTCLNIDISSVRIPFGVKKLIFNNKSNYNIQISIDDKYDNLKRLLNFITDLENDVKDLTSEDKTFEDKRFISRIYYSNNAPLITLDIKENTLFTDKNNNKLILEDYINRCFIARISFSYVGIYIGNKNFGLSLKIDEIIIDTNKEQNKITTLYF